MMFLLRNVISFVNGCDFCLSLTLLLYLNLSQGREVMGKRLMRYQRWTETSCLSWVIKTSQRERLMDFLFLGGLVCRWCLTRKWLRLSKENILAFNEFYTRTKKMTPPRLGRCQDLKVGCICFFLQPNISG